MAGILYLLMGTPGAGKSSFVDRNMHKGDSRAWISRDAIRFDMVKEGEPYFSKEDEVFKKFILLINSYLAADYDVYADATHLNKKSRAKVLRNLTVKPRKVVVIWIQTKLNKCLEQNELRAGTRSYVPSDDVRRMAHSLQAPDFDEGIDEIYIYKDGKLLQIIRPMIQTKEV